MGQCFQFNTLFIHNMNPVIRGVAIYLFLLVIFRIMGKRSLAESTTFDFVLLLIISEVAQEALVGQDYSLTGESILIITLISIDVIFTTLKEYFPFCGKVAEGAPLIIVEQGKPLQRRIDKCKLTEEAVLDWSRRSFGLERIEQIKFAVIETDGTLPITPQKAVKTKV